MNTRDDIIRMIEEEDIEFIRLQFTDMFGNLKNIAVTPGQIERVLNNKFSFEGAALYNSDYDPYEEYYLIPDLDSFVVLPWRPQTGKVGKMICDVCHADGSSVSCSPRAILKKVLEDARKEGYFFYVDPECEFFLFHTDDNGNPTRISHEKAGYLDVGPVDFGENARRDMVLTLEELGFEIKSSHHEKAPAQHEIDFSDAEALETADKIMTFRFAVRAIAKRFGLYATFIPKPRTDCAGSGMHLNFSLIKDGKDIFKLDENGNIPQDALYFIGGIMEHAKGMCAITNPTVNSYKRIVSGMAAPNTIAWSTKCEPTMLCFRKSKAKVENRCPDSAANPYLAIAMSIAAGLDGIKNKISPDKNAGKGKKLPGNLDEALICMHKDKLVCDTLGEEFVKIYSDIKNSEWTEYMTQVTDWEIGKYLIKM